MGKMVITEYWEKTADSGHTIRDVLKGQYERKSTVSFPNNGGWGSEEVFSKDRKKHDPKFEGKRSVTLDDGSTVTGYYVDLGTYYGIHSFQLITFEKEA